MDSSVSNWKPRDSRVCFIDCQCCFLLIRISFLSPIRAALLGPVGLDLPRVSHKLDVLSTITNFEPLEPIRETDIKGFLKNERENAILSVIEETRRMVIVFY